MGIDFHWFFIKMAEGGTSRLKNDTDENMDISNDMFMPPAENVTVLNLSGKYQDIEDLPPYLTHLNISHNNLKKVPQAVLQLRHLVHLDISFNKIEEFDDKPYFCDTIEQLDMSKNALIRPPYWIWSQAPAKLYYLKMFGNPFYERCFRSGQFERLLTYRTKITDLDLSNCCLRRKGLQLLITFPNVKNVTLGINDYSYLNRNHLLSLPCQGLDTFFGVERLIVCNTCISTVNSNITMFKHLIEIDLSENRLRDIPKEFSLLKNLEICDLSYNKLLYLPDNMNMMVRLRVLLLVGNDLCMVPANLAEIESLTTLDLYDNNIYEVSERLVERVAEIDLAQNYFDEPQTEAYMEKKQRLRLNKEFREDGRYNFVEY